MENQTQETVVAKDDISESNLIDIVFNDINLDAAIAGVARRC